MRTQEFQYLDLVADVLDRGDQRIDRTGVGTRSLFGAMTRFDLSKGQVPILTTKRILGALIRTSRGPCFPRSSPWPRKQQAVKGRAECSQCSAEGK